MRGLSKVDAGHCQDFKLCPPGVLNVRFSEAGIQMSEAHKEENGEFRGSRLTSFMGRNGELEANPPSRLIGRGLGCVYAHTDLHL